MSEHPVAQRGYGLDQSPITTEIQTTVSIRTKNGVVDYNIKGVKRR